MKQGGDSVHKTKQVELTFYKDEYSKALRRFVLPPEQGQFTALPKEIENVIDGQHRMIIVTNDEPVGFFLLHNTKRVQEYTDNPNAMLLTAFSINQIHQGKGYAKKGMRKLKNFVHTKFENCNEIVLAVNYKNSAAQQLYKKVGFVDTGKRKIGKIGEQIIMNLKI
ncbi:GNAT family N-acetyltransferase [Shouchella patagoniensis]|uniref:GNAT family N-acetyltransferase n=1 Tax=Shouchella patagoniensis TaxID=228576 RepID=UPI000995297C